MVLWSAQKSHYRRRRLTLIDVVAHDRDGIVDLRVDAGGFGIGKVGSTARWIRTGIARRDVRVVSAVVLCRHCFELCLVARMYGGEKLNKIGRMMMPKWLSCHLRLQQRSAAQDTALLKVSWLFLAAKVLLATKEKRGGGSHSIYKIVSCE